MPVNYYNYMDYALRSTARNQGAGLLLSGLGGDMTASFDGRDSLLRLLMEMKWGGMLRLARQISDRQGKSLLKILKNRIFDLLWFSWDCNPDGLLDYSPANPDFIYHQMTPNSYSRAVGDISRAGRKARRNYPSHLMEKIRNGKFVLAHEEIRCAHQGMSYLAPYFDRRIVEFFFSIPPQYFPLDGWPRGLFRRAMEGILPDKIRWRSDKFPYCPDFHRRVQDSKQEMETFLNSIEPNDTARQYIDVQKILKQLNRVKPVKGRKEWENKTALVVVRGIILIKFIHWINRNL
jgi:asparagine synthase (glutamine-hydrolysing)